MLSGLKSHSNKAVLRAEIAKIIYTDRFSTKLVSPILQHISDPPLGNKFQIGYFATTKFIMK